MRKSTVQDNQDKSGLYETEIFEAAKPTLQIICVHGNGVRRWDGENFFYDIANHYPDATVWLIDQNQQEGEGIRINPLPTLVARIDKAIKQAKAAQPDIPIVIIAHSMGCGVTTFVDTKNITAIVFVAPGAGHEGAKLIKRYGKDIARGKTVTTSDGLLKIISAEHFSSIKDVVWEDEYAKFAGRFKPIYVFEAGQEEIVGDDRFAHRDIPFTQYSVIEYATHNFSGLGLKELYEKLDPILQQVSGV